MCLMAVSICLSVHQEESSFTDLLFSKIRYIGDTMCYACAVVAWHLDEVLVSVILSNSVLEAPFICMSEWLCNCPGKPELGYGQKS